MSTGESDGFVSFLPVDAWFWRSAIRLRFIASDGRHRLVDQSARRAIGRRGRSSRACRGRSRRVKRAPRAACCPAPEHVAIRLRHRVDLLREEQQCPPVLGEDAVPRCRRVRGQLAQQQRSGPAGLAGRAGDCHRALELDALDLLEDRLDLGARVRANGSRPGDQHGCCSSSLNTNRSRSWRSRHKMFDTSLSDIVLPRDRRHPSGCLIGRKSRRI